MFYPLTMDSEIQDGKSSSQDLNSRVPFVLEYQRILLIRIIDLRNLLGIIHSMIDCSLQVSESDLHSLCYVHFLAKIFRKVMNLLNLPNYGLNNITAVFLQGWLRHWITHNGWYTIKQKNNNILPVPPIRQDMTQGQFLSGV